MKKTAKIFKCECYAHAVEVSVEDEGIELCMWTIGHDPTCDSFKERIRRAWHELTGKREWTDECILSPETAGELAKELLDAAITIKNQQTNQH
jgi:hypothetical protein